MPRRDPSLAHLPSRLSATVLAALLVMVPLPASASAAGPPAVETFDGTPLIGEFVAPGIEVGDVVVTWDEILDPRFAPVAADFTIGVNGATPEPAAGAELMFAGLATSELFFGDDGVTFMRLDLPTGVTVGLEDTVTVAYAPGANPVRDLALNPAPGFPATDGALFDAGGFNEFLAVVDSYHGADRVVVALSEPIEPASLPAAGQFQVTVDDADDDPVAVTSVASLHPEIGLGLIELTIDSPVTDPAAGVTVEYTSAPGALVSRYGGETLAAFAITATVIIASNATAAPLDAGDSLSTATGAGPTPGDPLETTITAAAGGNASITEGSVDEPAPPGYAFFGHQVVIEMPDAPSAATPNVLTFRIDGSVVPPGQNESTVQVFRDGVLVPACSGALGEAIPSPCVSDRQGLGGGDIELTVLTVEASTWHTGIQEPFAFDGFFAPIDNDVPNIGSAGRAIPVKFSLGGDRGLDIFADGSPSVRTLTCDGLEDGDLIEETVTAARSSLHYDAEADQYTYVWKTDRAWADTCRRLVIEFADGTEATATFDFVR